MITISRSQLEARMVKNHGMTPAEAKKCLDKGILACGLEQEGDKLALPTPATPDRKPELN